LYKVYKPTINMGICKQWRLGEDKFIRVIGEKVSFQRQMCNVHQRHRSRGLTIDMHSFLQMDDASLQPCWQKWLNSNGVLLRNNGKCIQLIKYCYSSDNKCCNGGYFSFSESEWSYFWNTTRGDISRHLFT